MGYFHIDLGSTSFISFLNYLVDEKEFSAKDIVHVVQKPYKYEKLYNKYMNDQDD